MKKIFAWLAWKAFYAVQPMPAKLGPFLKRVERTQYPWRKFKPCVYHNDSLSEWHVMLSDERSYTERRTIEVECLVGMESGRVVGFDIWDELLEAKQEAA